MKDAPEKPDFYVENHYVYHRGSKIGTTFTLEDGYRYVDLFSNHGLFSEADLRGVADALKEANADWDAQVQGYFEEFEGRPRNGL
jgi:hypothetical protein